MSALFISILFEILLYIVKKINYKKNNIADENLLKQYIENHIRIMPMSENVTHKVK